MFVKYSKTIDRNQAYKLNSASSAAQHLVKN